ncbi:MAG TPA: hypothetical protein VGQ46_09025, partial [Thermoanaerobaculia bacterium]|nr:hypothetical protein [Thermoanaerobaculia bacterium]
MEPTDDTARRKTLQTLIELAQGSSPADCWDDRRAEDLLRSQSSPHEVRGLGMSEEMISRVWGVGGGEWEKSTAGTPSISNGHLPTLEAVSTESGVGGGGSEQSTTNVNATSHTPRPTPHTPRFTVRVCARFEAAHFLREYRGISEPLHG